MTQLPGDQSLLDMTQPCSGSSWAGPGMSQYYGSPDSKHPQFTWWTQRFTCFHTEVVETTLVDWWSLLSIKLELTLFSAPCSSLGVQTNLESTVGISWRVTSKWILRDTFLRDMSTVLWRATSVQNLCQGNVLERIETLGINIKIVESKLTSRTVRTGKGSLLFPSLFLYLRR